MRMKLLLSIVFIFALPIHLVESAPTEYWSTDEPITATKPMTSPPPPPPTTTTTTTTRRPTTTHPIIYGTTIISSVCSRCYVKDVNGECRFNAAHCSSSD